MRSDLMQYTPDWISGLMSLRTPQKKSLEILADVVTHLSLRKGMNLEEALKTVHSLYPICTNFEHPFPSLTFALATGVGKTRLMGAFMAWLYTQHGIKNFFVVAPNTTIYEKLRREMSDPNHPKYVFRGLGCFVPRPQVITEEEYKGKNISFFDSNVHVYVYNIDKFNKEDGKMRKTQEELGNSFYGYLATLPDLVLLMDESHHYRAEMGSSALANLNPLLGLELTATPYVKKGNKQVLFQNVVYEYPLSKAIEGGYTRTPFAVTRSDIKFYSFGEEQLDRLMLQDGILCHERAKQKLSAYAQNYGKPVVKPFMLVVCQNTDHAAWVENYIKSDAFQQGAYRTKTIIVHSKQSGAENEANTRMLLEVERADNPVEIVIHVNKLKEGWDVNNLYTIVPLRTATSKILREQMVGRGLRLPYGERTGDKDVDAVMLTVHDKFNEILEEAQKGDSIFKAGNLIQLQDEEPEQTEMDQISLMDSTNTLLQSAYAETELPKTEMTDTVFQEAGSLLKEKVMQEIQTAPSHTVTPRRQEKLVEEVAKELSHNRDLGKVFRENQMPLTAWMHSRAETIQREVIRKFIPIPQIRVSDAGVEDYGFSDFDLHLTPFSHEPIQNDILIQNLRDLQDRNVLKGGAIDFEACEPKRMILAELRKKPEIDYEKCPELLFKLITQACEHYQERFGANGMKNIVMMYRREIADLIYTQMMKHFYCETGMLQWEVIGTRTCNLQRKHTYREKVGLFESFTGDIHSVLFTGIQKGVFESAKFDSREGELSLARLLERDQDVKNWLRPAPKEFNLHYHHGKSYEPDFVAETEDTIYLIEVKGEDKLEDAEVLEKRDCGMQYCEAASRWGRANGYKEWKYLFIPAKQIYGSSTFKQIAGRFQA